MTTMSNSSQAAQLPRLVPVLQRFPDEQITDPGAVLRAQLPAFCSAIQPGQSVAILVGDGALCRQFLQSFQRAGLSPCWFPSQAGRRSAASRFAARRRFPQLRDRF